MAKSSKDIESGCDGLKSPLRSEKEASLPSRSEKNACLDKKLRYFAFKLALLEKAASTLGTMNFIWATAVLLGGFSQSLKSIDFWFVSVILVVEGLRILCRRGELATRRSWSSGSMLTALIYLYSLSIQEYSATACIVLSSLRIQKQQYGSDGNLNRNRALNLFYSLSLVESSLSLLGFLVRFVFSRSSFFHDFNPHIARFMEEGSRSLIFYVVGTNGLLEFGLDFKLDEYFDTVRRFFDEAYSRCINGSVFDGLKMDFVSYSMEMLQSIDDNEQLIAGAQLLWALLKSDRLPIEKLRAIETPPGVLERLIDLLNWEKPQEQEIRTVAAEIISKLVEIPRHRIRLIAVPESIESIESLLYDTNQIRIHSSKYEGQSSYKYDNFSVLGKRILKILVNDPDNRAKIGTKKALLRKIIELENLNPNASESEIITHLEILSMEALASLAGPQDDRENINGTSGFEAEHSDDPNLQSVDSQV